MAEKSLHELFVEELRDMYDGEKRLTKALPKMARAAGSGELKTAITKHLQETERQVDRLEQVFRAIGETPRAKKCEGIAGMVAEGAEMMRELEGPVLDAALIAGAQKVEHYEIASYGTLAYFAGMLGFAEAKQLLGRTLEEERAADEKLTAIAKSRVNPDAMRGEDVEEFSGMALQSRRVGSRPSAPRGMAHDKSRRRTSGAGRSKQRGERARRSRR